MQMKYLIQISTFDFQATMNKKKIDGSLNTLNHSVTTVKSDIFFMRHCLLTITIPAKET